MSWREFLVFVDGADDGKARLQLAIDVARRFGGRLEALVLAPIPGPRLSIAADVLGDLYEKELIEARNWKDEAIEALRPIVQGAKDVHLHAVEFPAGEAEAAAARAAHTADLVMLGKPEEFDDTELDTYIFLGAVLDGGRPVLMFPRWINPHPWGERAVISWKGTPQAARAVQAALPFLAKAEAVRLCVANPRGEREGEDEASIARLATYLMRHDVKVEEPVMRESWEGPDRMIVSEVEGFNADFLVFGAYETGRISEELFGGVTPRMVKDATIPILLAH